MPPMKALIAFEASVRHASFKKAAFELHITPGAISQQISKLEQWLGYTLFTREVRQLKVTPLGLKYYASIAPALEQINAASFNHRKAKQEIVCLSLTQTLAAKWLAPRLGDFISRYPEIEVRINTSNALIDFKNDNVDLAIRYFDGNDSQLTAQLLYDDEICVFCSPEYLSRQQLHTPSLLYKATYISTILHPHWDIWLNSFPSLPKIDRKKMSMLYFDQTLLAIDAAKRGQGLVLSNLFLVEEELLKGELVELFQQRLSVDKSYYLTRPKDQPLSASAKLMSEWLLEQFESVN